MREKHGQECSSRSSYTICYKASRGPCSSVLFPRGVLALIQRGALMAGWGGNCLLPSPGSRRIWYSIAWLITKLRVTSSLEEKCKTCVREMSFPLSSRPHLAVGSLRPSPATSKRLSSTLKNHVLHSVPCVLHHHVKFSINSSE